MYAEPVGWELNPSMTEHLVTVDGQNRTVVSRMVLAVLDYNDLYGSYMIESHDPDGSLNISVPLFGRVHVNAIAADAAGNVYVGGSFMETMLMSTDSMPNVGNVADSFNINGFLFKLDTNSQVIWSRNLELTHPDLETIADLRIDPQGNAWYAWNEWDAAHLVKLDANGNDSGAPIDITGTVGISSFDFDPQGGVYIAGASDTGPVQFGTQTFNATSTYNLFVAHLDSAQGNPWVKFARDITFQSPKVDADLFGNAFVGGHVMDSLTLGNLQFNPPAWGTDFFLAKVNPQGDFLWGQQSPSMDSLSGEIEPASAKFIDTDTAGNVYLLANQRGVFNWGNGIESGNDGAPLNKSKVLVMKFDGTDGTPLFAVTAGLGSTNTHQLAVDQHKNIYFTQTLTDTAAYGYFTMNIPMYENHFLMAKLSYLEDTTISVSIDNLVANTFNVFPNPASTHVVVPQELQESELSVMDVTGKQVAHHQAVGNTVNVASLPSGVYMLLFRSDRVRYTGRLVKQ